LVHLVCAFRCLFPDLGITLSTRESAKLRNGLMRLGITDMSAESLTSPGGYSGVEADAQFDTTDHRSLVAIQAEVANQGLDAVVKDWDAHFSMQPSSSQL